MTAAILAVFAGYAIGSYGVVLVKGWDVPWKQWINPLDPWQWPSGAVPKAPGTTILPAGGGTAQEGSGGPLHP